MKLPIRVSEDSKEPIYHQIEHQIKALIVGGQLPPGTLLPSIRALANDLACSVITTRRAYQNLEYEKFIETAQGKGTFVSRLDHAVQDETKRTIVYDAMQKTIELGQQLGCTQEELRHVFDEAMERGGDNGG